MQLQLKHMMQYPASCMCGKVIMCALIALMSAGANCAPQRENLNTGWDCLNAAKLKCQGTADMQIKPETEFCGS